MVSAKSVLNGVIGDYLVATDNELATPMMLMRRPNEPLNTCELARELQQKLFQSSQSRLPIFILIHGLVSDEHCWGFMSSEDDRVDYGSLLERDIPNSASLYLRYNTGLHVSTNGKQLSQLLEDLMKSLPQVDISFICHSMGGLVARSSTQYALRQASTWIYSTSRILFLATPHQGTYWERAGNMVDCALDSLHYSTRIVTRFTKLRSQGIKDLRYGYTLEEDWKISAGSVEGSEQQQQQPVEATNPDVWRGLTNTRQVGQEQLLDWVSYHTVTGTVMSDPQHPISLLLGDGLVSKTSAQGKSIEPGHTLVFESTKEFPGITHNALPCSSTTCWTGCSVPESL